MDTKDKNDCVYDVLGREKTKGKVLGMGVSVASPSFCFKGFPGGSDSK